MKLANLISISQKDWLSGFKEELDERGAQKGLSVFSMLMEEKEESEILTEVYGEVSDRKRKTLNQLLSELYKEYLLFLLIHFRSYPERILANAKDALMIGKEERFDKQIEIVERVFLDTDNLEMQVAIYQLLRDHYYYKITKLPLYYAHQEKLTKAVEDLANYHRFEAYFIEHNLNRNQKTGPLSKEAFTKHRKFFETGFGSDNPTRTQVISRVFWLRQVFTHDYGALENPATQKVASEIWKLLMKKPFLFSNHPEFLQYSNLSYKIFTAGKDLSQKQFNELFSAFYQKFDGPWILDQYPRMYQAIISTQMKYLTDSAGIAFVDDERKLPPQVENGLHYIISLLKRVRDRPSYQDEAGKKYGLVTEALCLQYLSGNHLEKAAELYEFMLVQEQQNHNNHGKHVIYNNLCSTLFLNRSWDRHLEIMEKYDRFIAEVGDYGKSVTAMMRFQKMVSRIMLGEIEKSPDVLIQESMSIFGDDQKAYNMWAKYTIEHLKLN